MNKSKELTIIRYRCYSLSILFGACFIRFSTRMYGKIGIKKVVIPLSTK